MNAGPWTRQRFLGFATYFSPACRVTVLWRMKSRQRIFPVFTLHSVVSPMSATSHVVPRVLPEPCRPLLLNLPSPLPHSLLFRRLATVASSLWAAVALGLAFGPTSSNTV